jgi:hypothetical protein
VRDPHWHDETAALYTGDARQVLAEMAPGSADCIVASPPPWTPPGPQEPTGSGRYGEEATPALYIAALRRVFAQVHRVLGDHGTAWLIIGDRYARETGWNGRPAGRHRRRSSPQAMTGLPAKSLIGLPWQLAFALHDDGWIIRNAIVWHHPTKETQPATDRLPLSYELIFLLTKADNYHFAIDDQLMEHLISGHGSDAISHAVLDSGARVPRCNWQRLRSQSGRRSGRSGRPIARCRPHRSAATLPSRRHARRALPHRIAADVWMIPSRPQRHTLPPEVPLRCIAAGCRPGGTVVDPFTGDGTTAIAARKLRRRFIGIEQSPALLRLAEHRLRGDHDAGDDTR